MQKNHFLVLKIFKNTKIAQLWSHGPHMVQLFDAPEETLSPSTPCFYYNCSLVSICTLSVCLSLFLFLFSSVFISYKEVYLTTPLEA